ncbi:plastocyanin/azurin family copper-binding protein [Egicoccus halophilus]|uniref:plastocyanin/azurin family copper-binding protein n=1 Tax=Egicoccus halophilus TaxID=1670830 RepID=UPI0010323EB7|nr:plastocyanin/azurin family copper-binding protein [Egicoccus halophilus]
MRRPTLGLAATAGLLLVAGCSPVPDGAIAAEPVQCPEGSDCFDPIQPVGPGGDLEIDMGNFFFEVTDGTAVTGEVQVTVHNVSDAYHNAEFLGAADGSGIPEADANASGEDTVLLFPGEWTVICNVPGHRSAGMETTVTVYATEEEAAAAEQEAEGEMPEEGADPTAPAEEPELPAAGGGRDEADSVAEDQTGEDADVTTGGEGQQDS